RPAVDAGRGDRGHEPAVEPPVPAVHRPVAPLEIQFHAIDPAPPRAGWLAEIGRVRDVARQPYPDPEAGWRGRPHMQITEVSVIGVRSAVIELRRPGSPLRYVLFPMIHMGQPDV